MHLATVALLFVLVGVASCIVQCWVGQQTIAGGRNSAIPNGLPYSVVQCNDSDFCFNSYVKRHRNGDDSFTVTKSCGEPGKCFETGCTGPGDEKNCCCASNLCNSSNGLNVGVAGVLIILSLPFIRRLL